MDFSCDYDDIIYFLPFDLKFTYLGVVLPNSNGFLTRTSTRTMSLFYEGF